MLWQFSTYVLSAEMEAIEPHVSFQPALPTLPPRHTDDLLRVARRLIAVEAREFIQHAAHADRAQREWRAKAEALSAELAREHERLAALRRERTAARHRTSRTTPKPRGAARSRAGRRSALAAGSHRARDASQQEACACPLRR